MSDEIGHTDNWTVDITQKAGKQAKRLPPDIYAILALLRDELEREGPVQQEWRNYGKLKGKKGEYHHCHLNNGRPRYVAVWKVTDNIVRIMRIVFTGPHGSVNYDIFK